MTFAVGARACYGIPHQAFYQPSGQYAGTQAVRAKMSEAADARTTCVPA
jgi:hypothetical protein